jgi:hypothetical protein
MNQSKQGQGFVAFVLAVVAVLLSAYIVFLALKMARTDAARQTLLVLGVALAAGLLTAGAGLVKTRRR